MTQDEKDWETGILRGIERGVQIFLQSGEDTITLSADVETAKMLAAALRGPEPDPDTGLMPCGCGGVPVPYSWDETLFSGDTPCLDVTVACQKCGMGGNIWHESKLDAKNWWNTAMGWRVEG